MAALALIDGGPEDGPLWSGFSRFVPRLSWRDGFLLPELPSGEQSIAKSLAQAGGDAQLVIDAHRRRELRVILDPEAWRNQQAVASRSQSFRRLGPSVSLAAPLKPAALSTSSASALMRYAMAFANAQEARGADAVLTPSHCAGGYATPDREGELTLAAASVALYRRERVTERGESVKPLLIGVTLEASGLTDTATAVALARMYAALDADGFWVQFANLSEASPPDLVARAAHFLYSLQDLSQQRVFAVDVKNLIWPLMASGLFGGCIGIGEREAWAGPEPDSERRAIKPTVPHPELLRNFVAAGDAAKRVFRELPCECGSHEPEEPPLDRKSIRQHALRVRLLMAEAATSSHGVAEIKNWLAEASWAASDLDLDQPFEAAYRAVLDTKDFWREAA